MTKDVEAAYPWRGLVEGTGVTAYGEKGEEPGEQGARETEGKYVGTTGRDKA